MNQYFVLRETCPLCNSSDFLTLYETDYQSPDLKKHLTEFYTNQGCIEYQYLEGAQYHLCECVKCDFIFQKEIPGEFLSERLYEHWISPEYALSLEMRKFDLSQFWNFASDFTKVANYLQKPTNEISILDFGMGWGTTLQIYKSMGCVVFGCEIANSRISYATQNGIINLEFEELQTMQFDYIHCYQVMEHVDEPVQILKLLVNQLAPNGLIHITVPNGNSAKKDINKLTWEDEGNLRQRLIAVDPLEHINCFTFHTLTLLGKTCGLKPISLKLPIKHQTPYQLFRSTLRNPYHFLKDGSIGRMPSIVFKKNI